MNEPSASIWTPSRRQALLSSACGFGYLAMSAIAARAAAAAASSGGAAAAANPLAVKSPHHAPRAKRAIFIFMQGGPSHVDSFDYKPAIGKNADAMVDFEDARASANAGKSAKSPKRVMKGPWDFARHGQTGRWCSNLFPEINKHVDDLCFIHSMHTEGVAHGPATLFLHTGASNFVRPSVGSWVSYGLGTENENLPAFVSIAPSMGNGGPRNYGNAFLPAVYQGTPVGKAGGAAADLVVRNIGGGGAGSAEARRRFELLQRMNAEQLARRPGGDAELEAVINSYELAWRLQANAPDALDLSAESPETLAAYGVGNKTTDTFGRQCLMARRLCEAGVRYVQVTYGDSSANPAWDQHSNLPKHGQHAAATDRPVAALLADLKARGLLEDTVVWWGGEFGRTPYAEKNGTGRDHNPGGFTVWLAGGGVKPAFAYGATDEFGHHAVQDKVHMHDLHATILHLLGLDHEKLTYRYAGRDFRLTDVHGRVVNEIIA